jgi:hypothetical protein
MVHQHAADQVLRDIVVFFKFIQHFECVVARSKDCVVGVFVLQHVHDILVLLQQLVKTLGVL